VVIVNKHYWPP